MWGFHLARLEASSECIGSGLNKDRLSRHSLIGFPVNPHFPPEKRATCAETPNESIWYVPYCVHSHSVPAVKLKNSRYGNKVTYKSCCSTEHHGKSIRVRQTFGRGHTQRSLNWFSQYKSLPASQIAGELTEAMEPKFAYPSSFLPSSMRGSSFVTEGKV